MLGRLVHLRRNPCIGNPLRGIEHPQLESGTEQTCDRAIDRFLVNESLLDSLMETGIGRSAVQIRSRANRQGCGLSFSGHDLVSRMNIIDRAAV